MPVNLSIKNVPDDLAERLRQRAARNHRSVQGELMALIEAAAAAATGSTGGVSEPQPRYRDEGMERPMGKQDTVALARTTREFPGRKLTVAEIVERVKRLDLPRVNDAVRLVREDRDSR